MLSLDSFLDILTKVAPWNEPMDKQVSTQQARSEVKQWVLELFVTFFFLT